MNVEKIKSFNLRDIILISSLPDMGKVGGLVTQHLIKVMDATKTAKIVLHDKPWINQKDGIIEYPSVGAIVDDHVLRLARPCK